MNSLISKNIEHLELKIAQELSKLPKSSDVFDNCVDIWQMSLDEFNLDIKAVCRAYGNTEPFFYTGPDFDDEGFDLSATLSVLQSKGLMLEEIKYFLERVLETIKESSREDSLDTDLPF